MRCLIPPYLTHYHTTNAPYLKCHCICLVLHCIAAPQRNFHLRTAISQLNDLLYSRMLSKGHSSDNPDSVYQGDSQGRLTAHMVHSSLPHPLPNSSTLLFYSVLFPHALGTNKISLSFLWGDRQILHEDMCQLPPPPYIFIAQYESEPNIHSQCLALLLWIHHPSLHFTSHAHSTIRRFSRSLLPCPASDITFYCHARISLIFPQLDLITYSDCLILIYFILYYIILYYIICVGGSVTSLCCSIQSTPSSSTLWRQSTAHSTGSSSFFLSFLLLFLLFLTQ